MPRARGKGGKNRKKTKATQDKDRRELVFKEDGQEYAQVIRLLGNGRVECQCMDGKKRTCLIRGSMRNRVWIRSSDIVLLGLREFGDDGKADVILKYYVEEARELQEVGELPEHIRIDEIVDDLFEEEEEEVLGAAMGGEESDEEEEKKEVNIDDI